MTDMKAHNILDELEQILRRAKAIDTVDRQEVDTALSRRRSLKKNLARLITPMLNLDLKDPPAWAKPEHILRVVDVAIWCTSVHPTLDVLERLECSELMLSYVIVAMGADPDKLDDDLIQRVAFVAYHITSNWGHLVGHHAEFGSPMWHEITQQSKALAEMWLVEHGNKLDTLLDRDDYEQVLAIAANMNTALLTQGLDEAGIVSEAEMKAILAEFSAMEHEPDLARLNALFASLDEQELAALQQMLSRHTSIEDIEAALTKIREAEFSTKTENI